MNCTKIDTLKSQLDAMRALNAAELTRLRNEFIIENTYDSNAIEGSTLTLRETALILQEGITIGEKPLKEHLEAIGHRDAFHYIEELANGKAAITEKAIRDIHSLVLMNDAMNRGKYRNVPVMIMGARHTPPQPWLVPVQMEQLLADYPGMQESGHIIAAIAEFHLRFEGIHPFIDGNGRTGRLLMNLELIKAGLLPVNIKFADRRRYYDCLDSYATEGRVDALADLLAAYEEEELTRRIRILAELLSGQ